MQHPLRNVTLASRDNRVAVDPADPVRMQGYGIPFPREPIDRSTPLEVPLNRSGPG
jgi:hypothetical protein